MKKITSIFLSLIIMSITLTSSVYAVDSEPKVSSSEEFNESEMKDSQMSEKLPSEDDSLNNTVPKNTIENSSDMIERESGQSSGELKEEPKLSVPSAEAIPPPAHEAPSRNGIYIFFPLRTGILYQPQEEQYIVEGSSAKLEMRATSWGSLFAGVKTDILQWTLQPDGKTWSKSVKVSAIPGNMTVPNFYELDTSIPNLKEGTYYFQYKATLITVPAIGVGVTYYSNLAKVVVKKTPVSATSLSVSAPKVVFEKAAYSANAVPAPIDTTSPISWSSSLGTKLKFAFSHGRQTGFTVNEQLPDINTDVNAPGIPFNLMADTVNVDGSKVSDSAVTYLGGLAAKSIPLDLDTTWELDAQGLLDLRKAVGGDNTWKYKWEYFDENGTVKQFVAADGVSKYVGNMTSVTELNDPAYLITFTKNSSFMKRAADATKLGKPYATQVTFTTTVDTGNGKTETVSFKSSKAQFSVNPPVGKLTLDGVPSFRFGTIPASLVYKGTDDGTNPKTSEDLKITDTRSNSGGWELTATMIPFANGDSGTLETTSQIKLSGLPAEIDLSDDGVGIPIAHSTQSELWNVQGTLSLRPNPKTVLKGNEVFSSTITWNLVSSVVEVKAVE